MVAILIGMADEIEEAREVFRPLTSGTGETIEGQGRVIDGDTLEERVTNSVVVWLRPAT